MSPFADARMHLGVEIGGAGRHPGAARWTGTYPEDAAGVLHHLAMITTARRGLDFVAMREPDHADGPSGTGALELVGRIAPLVSGIGLVPAATITTADPDVLAAALAAVEAASADPAGWEPVVPPSDELDPSDTVAGGAAGRWRRVAAVLERLAELRQAGTGDGASGTLQHVDFAAGGVPARPLVVLRADEPAALPVVARWADVARISATGLDAAHDARGRVRAAVAAAGRDPDEVVVMLDVEVHLATDRYRARAEVARLDAMAPPDPALGSTVRVLGPAADIADLIGATVRLGAADGVTLIPLVLPADLRRVADELIPLLAGRGLLRGGWSGLRRPALRWLTAAGARSGAPWRQVSA